MNRYLSQFQIVIFLVFSPFVVVWAQKPIGTETPSVQVIGKATSNSIMLRWAVTTPTSWKQANQYGYTIERQTIAIGNEVLATPIRKVLTPSPILPKPMPYWETLVDTNTNAAVVAQALYGEDFSLQMEEGGSPVMSIINQAEAIEQRFSFALFAADQDFEVAKMAGLGFVDRDVRAGERYLYRIYTAIPEKVLTVSYGGIYLGLDDYIPLPEPLDFSGVFNDRNVILSWDFDKLKSMYTNYSIERSSDQGRTFKELDNLPVVNLNTGHRKSNRMIFMDSLPKNAVEYQYRIKGISPFGETGPVSEVVSGKSTPALYYTPSLEPGNVQENNTEVVLTWNFPEAGLHQLSHFELRRADHIKGNYTTVVNSIPKDKRSLTYGPLAYINYFVIAAIGLDGTEQLSFPQMVEPEDNTPPEIPTEIISTIDSTGIVKLQWKSNIESDFMGYRVFRAHLEDEEFLQITTTPVEQPFFQDTVVVKSLNSKVYYKLQALDIRYNPSEFSETIVVKKPDVIPPTQPVITTYKVDERQVFLEWTPSSSQDALQTLIYRKLPGKSTDWQLVGEKILAETTFTDTNVEPLHDYLYTLITIDESGLESEPVQPLLLSVPDIRNKPKVENFRATVNREERYIQLQWKYRESSVIEYQLYKSKEDEAPSQYKILTPKVHSFKDVELQINTTYQYYIQAVFESGVRSPLSQLTVQY